MVFNRRGRPSQANYHNYKKGNYYYYNKPAVVHSRGVTSCSSPRYEYEYERRESLMEVSQPHRPNYVSLETVPASHHQQETTKGKNKLCGNYRVDVSNFPNVWPSQPHLNTHNQNHTGTVANAHVHSNTTQSIKVSCTVRERMKHPQLRGADIYVARLGRTGCTSKRPPPRTTTAPLSPHSDSSICDSTSPTSGSLHDELVNPHPRTRQCEVGSRTAPAFVPPHATDSRPCYRCVEYMNSCGISRVFWTDQDGCWKRAKVRDLVSALREPGEGGGEDPAVFITKHEVLLLRRLMEGAGR